MAGLTVFDGEHAAGTGTLVRAAGVVVLRERDATVEVLAVHRPRYDDWSLPKGKLEAGEHPLVAAVREVVEETGVRPVPGCRLPSVRYTDALGRPKIVQWWLGGIASQAAREPDEEVDDQRWLPLATAGAVLTHAMDTGLLAGVAGILDRDGSAGALPEPPVVLLRHASARSRKSWDGKELERPLDDEGLAQAAGLVPLLLALAPARVITSAARRCRQTVGPYLAAAGESGEITDELTEQAGDDDPRRPRAVLTDAIAARAVGTQVLCTHRPVLGTLLGTAAGRHWRAADAKALRPAEFAVLTGRPRSMTVDRYPM